MGVESGIRRRTCPWSCASLCGQVDIEGTFVINNACHSREHSAHCWGGKTKESLKFHRLWELSLGRRKKAQQASELQWWIKEVKKGFWVAGPCDGCTIYIYVKYPGTKWKIQFLFPKATVYSFVLYILTKSKTKNKTLFQGRSPFNQEFYPWKTV